MKPAFADVRRSAGGHGSQRQVLGIRNLGIEPDVFSAKGLAAASQLGLLCANHSVMYSSREIMPARLAAIPCVQRHCVWVKPDGKICCKMQERVSS